ncbi:hypothetical protein [Marinimicrobium alkaliphilum]|uniref:hypothetical protein n=1 Tax=Marinimicrobium alkaliphilum TaxID=2202654 RepID=UPI0013005525|nr:hypothetical protein [Marinimicrobium alkaliphilum]
MKFSTGLQYSVLILLALGLFGCGGSSSSPPPSTTTPPPVTTDPPPVTTDPPPVVSEPPAVPQTAVAGTAAAGAPISGFVAAKDSEGNAVSGNIAENGRYQLDLSTLNPPYLLYVSGVSGGQAYQLLSVAFADNLGGTVNITPLTDLVVGNVTGESPTTFFNAPNFSLLTESAVLEEAGRLAARLQPVFEAFELSGDFNVLTSPFSANRSGFDAVLDVLDISINQDTGVATIRNKVSGDSITNDFANPESGTEPLAAGSSLANHFELILGAGSVLEGLIELASIPVAERDGGFATEVGALLAEDLLINGLDKASVIGIWTDEEEAQYLADELRNDFLNWGVASVTPGSPNEVELWVSTENNGPLLFRDDGSNANWQMVGDGNPWYASLNPTYQFANAELLSGTVAAGAFLSAGVEPRTFAGYDACSTDQVFVFTGPGLEGENSLELSSPGRAVGQTDNCDDGFGIGFVLENPFTLVAMQRGEEFRVTRYTVTSENPEVRQPEETVSIFVRQGAPITAEGVPTITEATLEGEAFALSWTLPQGYSVWGYDVWRHYAGGEGTQGLDRFERALGDPRVAANATSATNTLPAPNPDFVLQREEIVLFVSDIKGVEVQILKQSEFEY